MDLFSFDGRIRRRDYWFVNIGAGIAMALAETLSEAAPVIYLIIMILLMWISFAAGAKRCHDLGHNGWWQLIPFYSLWMAFQEGERRGNKYGPNPKRCGVTNQTPQSTPSTQTTSTSQTSAQQQTTPSSHINPAPWNQGSQSLPSNSNSTGTSAQNNNHSNLTDSISSKWK